MSEEPLPEIERKVRQILEERFEGITRRIDDWLEEARTRGEAIQQIVSEALQQPFLRDGDPVSGRRAGAPDEDDHGPLEDLATFAREMECTVDQGKILARLIDSAAALTPRVVLFIVKGATFRAWSGRGLPEGLDPRAIRLPLEDDSVIGEALHTRAQVREVPGPRAGNRAITDPLGEPKEMLAIPLWVRDRVAAVLYADTPGDPWYPDAIAVMTSLAALSLEALPARARFPRRADPPAPRAAVTPAAQPPAPAPRGTVHEPPAPPATDEQAEEARRFARLLVSEIALYNERAIEEGRRTGDLYERLKEDIDRSRAMFQQRFPSSPACEAFFRQEIVRTLAGGDESALALPWD